MKTPAALAILSALVMTAAGGALDFAYRLPAEIQTPGPQALPELTWQQGCTPMIRVDVLARGRPVDADTNTTVRMIIGQTATNLYYVVASNSVTTGTSYYVQWPTVGTNSAGTNATAQAWWYTIYFERDGHRYWTGNGDLYIEPTTSTAEDGLTWQTVTAGYAEWGTITGSITSQADLVAALAGKAGTASVAQVASDLSGHTGDTTMAHGGIVADTDPRLTDARTPTAHDQDWSTVTGTPTTLSGYGITDSPDLAGWSDYPATNQVRLYYRVVNTVYTNLIVTGSLTPDVTGTYSWVSGTGDTRNWAMGLGGGSTATVYYQDFLWSLFDSGDSLWQATYGEGPTGDYFAAISETTTGTATVAYSIITNSVTNTIAISGLSGTHVAISTNTTVDGIVTATAFSVSGTSVFHAATITTGAALALVTNGGVLGITVHEQRPLGTGATDAYPGDAGADASNRIVALESPYQAWTVLDPGEGETCTIAIAHGSLVSITATNGLTTIEFDNTGYGTQGVSRVGVELWAGTNAIGFDSATITNPTAPTISTDTWNSLYFRRTADNALWEGRQ